MSARQNGGLSKIHIYMLSLVHLGIHILRISYNFEYVCHSYILVGKTAYAYACIYIHVRRQN